MSKLIPTYFKQKLFETKDKDAGTKSNADKLYIPIGAQLALITDQFIKHLNPPSTRGGLYDPPIRKNSKTLSSTFFNLKKLCKLVFRSNFKFKTILGFES